MPTAFVTGANGFFGSHLVQSLVDSEWSVVGFRRAHSATGLLDSLPIEQRVGDVQDYESVVNAVPNRVDAVFHVAGNSSYLTKDADEQFKANVDGTRNTAQAALTKRASRFIFTSSLIAFGQIKGLVDENTRSKAPNSRVNYAKTKWLAEKEVTNLATQGLDTVILRPASMIGPYDTRGWGRFLVGIATNRIRAFANVTLDFCSPHQAALAHMSAATISRPNPVYLLGGSPASLPEIAVLVKQLMDDPHPIRTIPRSTLPLIAQLGEMISRITNTPNRLPPQLAAALQKPPISNSSLAENDLGYTPQPIAKMIERAMQWLIDQQLVPNPHQNS